jgi:hypothetical protein
LLLKVVSREGLDILGVVVEEKGDLERRVWGVGLGVVAEATRLVRVPRPGMETEILSPGER